MLVDCKNHIQVNGLLRESSTNPGRLSPARPAGAARKNTDIEMEEVPNTLLCLMI